MTDTDGLFYFRYNGGNRTIYLQDSSYWGSDSNPPPGEERLSLSELHQALRSSSSLGVDGLQIRCGGRFSPWSALDEPTWRDVCRLLQTHLPRVTSVQIVAPNSGGLGDEKCRMLLQHLPRTLRRLKIGLVHGDLPLTFEQIGQSFRQLQELRLTGGVFWEPAYTPQRNGTGRILAQSIQQLSQLRVLELSDIVSMDGRMFWGPVFDVIRTTPSLEEFQGEKFFREVVHGELRKVRWGKVEALIAVRDRVDCLDHLLSNSDPGLFALIAT
jgi:hypothetical protein